jgi:hypothetical protein
MEAGSPKVLFELVDLKPIHGILWVGLHLDGPGQQFLEVFSPLKGCAVKGLE